LKRNKKINAEKVDFPIMITDAFTAIKNSILEWKNKANYKGIFEV